MTKVGGPYRGFGYLSLFSDPTELARQLEARENYCIFACFNMAVDTKRLVLSKWDQIYEFLLNVVRMLLYINCLNCHKVLFLKSQNNDLIHSFSLVMVSHRRWSAFLPILTMSE